MSVQLDHLIVPASDRVASARLLATILGVRWAEQRGVGPFSQVYVNDGLTLGFNERKGEISPQHDRFRVASDAFDAMLGRLKAAGIPYRSTPHGPVDHQVNPRSAAGSCTAASLMAMSGKCSP